MTTQEKERLGLALIVSLGVHVIAFFIVQFADWRVAPLPEFSGPMYVTMAEVERAPEEPPEPAPPEEPPSEEPPPPPEPEGLATTPEDAAEEQQPEEAPEPPPAEEPPREEPAPAEPEATPAEPPPGQPDRAPRAEQAPRAEATPDAETATPEAREPERVYEYSLEDIYERETRPGTRQAPPEDEEFQRLPSEGAASEPDVELPEWARRPRETVEEAGFSTEDVSEEDVEELAEKVATDPEFERTLRDVISALDRRATDAQDARPGADGEPGAETTGRPERDADTEGTPGDSRFEWVGTGDRRLSNPPAVPEGFFSARDFGGTVPARATFVVVFEVDWRGNVVPGSVIFQQGSEYVVAKERLRGRARGWTFEPAEGADVATGIFTLVVRREDIR
jgi:hypothetical protein